MEILNRRIKLWKVLIIIVIVAFVFVTPNKERIIEKEVIKEIPVEKIIEKDCSIEKQNLEKLEQNIRIYEKILELDNKAFLLLGEALDNIFDVDRTDEIIKQIEAIALEKSILLNQIK